MERKTALELAILIILGLLPILWLPKEGYIISDGDNFPLFLNPHHVLGLGMNLWSRDFLGYATPTPALALYQYPAVFLNYLGLSIGNTQIFYQVILFVIAALSIYYFSKTIYPELRMAPFIAGFFYMFNIFALTSRQNTGFIWIYAFLPLLLALFIKIARSTYENNNRAANKNIIYFSLLSVVTFSFAAINPANVALGLIGVAILALYYLIKFRSQFFSQLKSWGKILGLSIPLNIWWIIPILNYYFISNQVFNSTVGIEAWDWTQSRSSFLNLFWLNGIWSWSPDYFPFFNDYKNAILMVVVFVPFLIAASALLFRSKESRFNLYVMGAILVLLFMASGVNSPLGDLNLLISKNIPLMSMFREPVSKFTLLIIPFLALLVGFGSERIAKLRLPRLSFHSSKLLIISAIMLALILAVQPLLISTNRQGQIIFNNPIESKTEILPYSSYVEIPSYWYQATSWINSQPGDGKVLLTPIDDFYEMPYNWTNGYYGTDQLINSMISKPIVSTSSLSGYKINNDTLATLLELGYAIRYGRVNEFKDLLDVLSVQYILQRNDINSDFLDRNTLQDGTKISEGSILPPLYMKNFFTEQSYLKPIKFGDIDIYEYTDRKPTIYVSSLSALQKSNIAVQSNITLQKDWDFSQASSIKDWQFVTFSNNTTANSTLEFAGNKYLQANLDSTWNQGKIESTLMQSQYGNVYEITFYGRGHSTSHVNVTIVQYSEMPNENDHISKEMVYGPHDIYWEYDVTGKLSFEPFPETKYFKIQVWFNISDPRTPWLLIHDIKVTGKINFLNTNGLSSIFNETLQNQAVKVTSQNTSPTKTILSVNAKHPFVLLTSYVLDDSWVAKVNGHQISPTPFYLGLSGFEINQTGQFDIVIEYKPQTWFNYALAISLSSLCLILAIYLYVSRDSVRRLLKKTSKRRNEDSRWMLH